MAGIGTTIRLNDMITAPLMNITNALNMTINGFSRLDSAADMDFSEARRALASAGAELQMMLEQMAKMKQSVKKTGNGFVSMKNKITALAGAYAGLQGVKKTIEASDDLAQTTARLNLMNDGLQTTQELQTQIFQSAQNARGSYSGMAQTVSKLGILAGDAFSTNAETVKFAEQLQKQFVLGGASVQEQTAGMYQLTQAMAAGKLQGDEFRSIMENAPMLAQIIADKMGKTKGELRELSAEGAITADIIKAAVLEAADETDEKFASMPMTFGQIWQSICNQALMAFQPALTKMNEVANSEKFNVMVEGLVNGLSAVAMVATKAFEILTQGAGFVIEHWSLIGPIILGVATALGVYASYLAVKNAKELIGKGITIAACFASYAKAAATGAEVSADAAATAAQRGYNAALLACPITWILIGLIALITIILIVAGHIAKTGDVATTTFGVITGGINVVIQFFKNLGLSVANIALGIGSAIAALGKNIKTAFFNAISSVQAWWYGLLATATNVIAGICAALNKLPFVNFDYSDITNAANTYAAKSAKAAADKGSYTDIGDAFHKGMSTFDTFGKGWASDAYKAGAAWGDKVSGKLSEAFGGSLTTDSLLNDSLLNDSSASTSIPQGISNGVSSIDKNTDDIKSSVQSSAEDLKLIRQLAEKRAVNRITNATIKVDMSGMSNQINDTKTDIDGFVSTLTKRVEDAMLISAEGVHI